MQLMGPKVHTIYCVIWNIVKFGAVFRFPDSEQVIDSGEKLDDFIVHMSKKTDGC